MEPMLLCPAGKDYLWGGNRLKSTYGKEISLTPLAETWECSVHPDGPSMVASGNYQVISLKRVLDDHPEYLGKKAKGHFPILVKLIDAKKDLSVQVHPDDAYAWKHERQNGKTEMWYVLDADPGAQIICGFAHDVTAEMLKEAIDAGQLNKHLQKTEVHKGDVFFIPPGTIHAIGAGVMVAEVQENSNVTYRVYDYNRVDKDGNKRELHFEKAVQVLNMNAAPDMRQRPRRVLYTCGCARENLCRCRYFETDRIVVRRFFDFCVTDQSFQTLLCTDGEGTVTSYDMYRTISFRKGDCIFIPAGIGVCRVSGQADLLKIRC